MPEGFDSTKVTGCVNKEKFSSLIHKRLSGNIGINEINCSR